MGKGSCSTTPWLDSRRMLVMAGDELRQVIGATPMGTGGNRRKRHRYKTRSGAEPYSVQLCSQPSTLRAVPISPVSAVHVRVLALTLTLTLALNSYSAP